MSASPRARPWCFGQITDEGQILVDPDEEHHLLRVLRVEAGDEVEVSGEGRLVLAEVVSAGRRELRLRAVRELQPEQYGAVPVRLCAAVLHGPAMERLVHLAAELHAARITPVISERTQHQGVSGKLLERWRRIARSACKQARRVEVPIVEEARDLGQLLEESPMASTLRLCLRPRGARLQTRDLSDLPQPEEIWLLQGPEGGWGPEELVSIEAAGFEGWALGRAVFRAETCPMVALTLLHKNFGELFKT